MRIFSFFLACLFLVGCAEVELAAHVAKQIPASSQTKGTFKVGSPYKIDGKWYRPQETYNFTQTGIASWYGPQFHGKKTANGEIFNMNELTAAHKTIQMPSLVRVTNLENGKVLIVRVNDRGPFKKGRVIDLSRRSAELLGFKNQGIARVRIDLLAEESRAIAEVARRGQSTRGVEIAMNEKGRLAPLSSPQAPPQQKQQEEEGKAPPGTGLAPHDLAAPEVAQAPVEVAGSAPVKPVEIAGHMENGRFLPDPVVKQVPVVPTKLYVQAGSFSSEANAARLAKSLEPFGQSSVQPALINGQQFYRVRIGPIADVQAADMVLANLENAGRGKAIIIVD